MNKLILGTKENFHNQLNDASAKILKAYSAKETVVNCFWNACGMALEITKWINSAYPLWKIIQWPDYALSVQYNPKHLHILENVDIKNDEDSFKGCHVRPLNQFPEYGKEIINRVLFNSSVAFYSKNENAVQFDIIKQHIVNKNPVVTSSHLYGGHFICFHGYDGDKLIYSDSAKTGGWYNEMQREDFDKIVKKYFKIWFAQKNGGYI